MCPAMPDQRRRPDIKSDRSLRAETYYILNNISEWRRAVACLFL